MKIKLGLGDKQQPLILAEVAGEFGVSWMAWSPGFCRLLRQNYGADLLHFTLSW